MAVSGIVSLGLILHVLQSLFVLFFTCWRETASGHESGTDTNHLPITARQLSLGMAGA